jgi:acid phosphatase (class A)
MSDYIKYANNAISSTINNIKYSDKQKIYKVSPYITIGWEGVLPEPPLNNSDTTKKELEYIQNLTKNLTTEDQKLISKVDKDPKFLYIDTLNKLNLPFPEKEFAIAYNIVRPIILNLKYIYNRPRPLQLATAFGYNINVIVTDTINTPSYPSGHSSYAAVCAYLLAAMYPEHSGHFFDHVGTVSRARMMQGVHYPSDTEASMVITGAIWEDIRYKLFPELKQF